MLDLDLDPLTRDLVDTDDGGAQEVADSRPAVLWQLEERIDEHWSGEGTGSRIAALLEQLDPVTTEQLRDEALRALQLLVTEGVIADLGATVEPDTERPDRALFHLAYTDVGTGLRVEDLIVPFGAS